MAKLHVIVVAYERPIALRCLIDCFLLQTNPNWMMTIVHDGPASYSVKQTMSLYDNDKRVCWLETAGRQGNWGLHNRKAMLNMLVGNPGDFVLSTNDDNFYIPRFVEFMMKEAQGKRTGFVFCNFLHHNFDYDIMETEILVNHIDMGAFIVELNLAQEVGFNHSTPDADGRFAMECAEKCRQLKLRIVRIPKVLFIHN